MPTQTEHARPVHAHHDRDLDLSPLERLLSEHADELDTSIRRGHEVVGVSQGNAAVAAAVRGPDGPYQVTARYLVGCDGAHSKVRGTTGIPFPECHSCSPCSRLSGNHGYRSKPESSS